MLAFVPPTKKQLSTTYFEFEIEKSKEEEETLHYLVYLG